MFENVEVVATNDLSTYGQDSAATLARDRTHELDSPDMVQLHTVLMSHWAREIDRQADARAQMAEDEAFYDGDQWTQKEIATLEDRGQVPLVFNVIHTTTNWVLGTERRMKSDFRVLPRRKEGGKHAERKTQLLKHVSDASKSHMAYSRAFQAAVRAGLGFLETGYATDSTVEPVYERFESWRNVIWDSTSTEPDMSDARYIMRAKWIDADLALKKFPDRRAVVSEGISNAFDSLYGFDAMGDEAMDSQEEAHFQTGIAHRGSMLVERPRLRVYEIWFRRVAEVQVMKGGQWHGQEFDPWSPGHIGEVAAARAVVRTDNREAMWCAIATDAGLLWVGRSPYRHGRFPFTPVWGNRRADDGMPYGLIRQLKDIQRDLNKRAAKSLYILSVKRSFVPKGSVDDIEQFRDEVARPDAVIEYDPAQGVPTVEGDNALAAAHSELMSRDIEMIQQTSGVTDENLGRRSNATSGVAIERRQTQGAMATAHFFENYAYARKCHGEKVLENIEQFYTDELQFRITNQRGVPDYVTINDPSDADSLISNTRADFILDEIDWNATHRQAMVAQLMELAMQMAATAPQFLAVIIDLIVEAMDLPNGEEIVKRIRQQTGLTDPDADPANPDPETMAMMEAKAKQAAFAEAMAEAELMLAKGKAAEAQARAVKTQAEAEGKADERVSRAVADLKAAIEAAQPLLGNIGVAQIADRIIQQAKAEAGGAAPAPEDMAPAAAATPMPPQNAGPGPMGATQPPQMVTA